MCQGKIFLYVIVACAMVASCNKSHKGTGYQDKSTLANAKSDTSFGAFTDTLFYEGGNILAIRNFKNNVLNGDYISFYESGAIMFEYQNKNGRRSGKGIKYFENGNIAQIGYSIYGFQYGGAYFYNEVGNYLETYVATDHSHLVFYSVEYDSNLNVVSEQGNLFSSEFFITAKEDSIDSKKPFICKIAVATPPHVNVSFYIKDGYNKNKLKVTKKEIIDNTVTYEPKLKRGKILFSEYEAIAVNQVGDTINKYTMTKEYKIY